MEYIRLMLGGLTKDTRAVTAVEYALMAGLIAVAIVVAVSGVASSIQVQLNAVSSAI